MTFTQYMEALRESIAAGGPHAPGAFGAACAERLLPVLSADLGGPVMAQVARESVDAAWTLTAHPEILDRNAFAHILRGCDELANEAEAASNLEPGEDEPPRVIADGPEFYVADATSAVHAALVAARDRDLRSAESAARACYGAAQRHVTERIDTVDGTPRYRAAVSRSVLLRTCREQLERDAREIAAFKPKDRRDLEAFLQRIRDRARSEAPPFVRQLLAP